MKLLSWPINASDRILDKFCVISMEFLSLSRRRPSSRNVPQRQWSRRNVCRSYATFIGVRDFVFRYYTRLSTWYILRMPIRGREYTEHTVHRDCNQLALGTTVLHLCHDGLPGLPQHRHQCTQIRWHGCDHSEMSSSTRGTLWSTPRDTCWSQGS